MKYGSGPARFPLPDMLQYVLEFIATKSAVPVSPECVSSAQDSETTVLQSQAGSCILDMLSQPNRLVDRKKNIFRRTHYISTKCYWFSF